MYRKVFTIALVLAMLLGVANFAVAAPANTDGSIAFEEGGVIIVPPGSECTCCRKCCTCGCKDTGFEDPCDDCPCPCNCDEDYDNFFAKLGVENSLYFGEHNLAVFGRFDSANKPGSPKPGDERYTTDDGEFTGIEVINQLRSEAKVGVQISRFMVGGVETLAGADLTLKSERAIAEGGGTPYSQKDGVMLTGDTQEIISVNSGRAVKAAWYGLLDTCAGTAVPGKAQAELTWTVMATP